MVASQAAGYTNINGQILLSFVHSFSRQIIHFYYAIIVVYARWRNHVAVTIEKVVFFKSKYLVSNQGFVALEDKLAQSTRIKKSLMKRWLLAAYRISATFYAQFSKGNAKWDNYAIFCYHTTIVYYYYTTAGQCGSLKLVLRLTHSAASLAETPGVQNRRFQSCEPTSNAFWRDSTRRRLFLLVCSTYFSLVDDFKPV